MWVSLIRLAELSSLSKSGALHPNGRCIVIIEDDTRRKYKNLAIKPHFQSFISVFCKKVTDLVTKSFIFRFYVTSLQNMLYCFPRLLFRNWLGIDRDFAIRDIKFFSSGIIGIIEHGQVSPSCVDSENINAPQRVGNPCIFKTNHRYLPIIHFGYEEKLDIGINKKDGKKESEFTQREFFSKHDKEAGEGIKEVNPSPNVGGKTNKDIGN